jgi:hypothetical protein
MTHAIIKRFPDTSGCNHGPAAARRAGVDMELAFCPDCKFSIAFHLDKDGKRTGLIEIVELEELA